MPVFRVSFAVLVACSETCSSGLFCSSISQGVRFYIFKRIPDFKNFKNLGDKSRLVLLYRSATLKAVLALCSCYAVTVCFEASGTCIAPAWTTYRRTAQLPTAARFGNSR